VLRASQLGPDGAIGDGSWAWLGPHDNNVHEFMAEPSGAVGDPFITVSHATAQPHCLAWDTDDSTSRLAEGGGALVLDIIVPPYESVLPNG